MENFLPYLPLVMHSSSPSWPPEAAKVLGEVETGRVQSGGDLFCVIVDLRNALSLSTKHLAPSTVGGYVLFFDQVMSIHESIKWFNEVVPALAKLLLRLPSLLEVHYQNANMDIHGEGTIVTTALRILNSHQPGLVFLSQELIAALLGC